jgi:tetratricopeptide (TPR) repeat protein
MKRTLSVGLPLLLILAMAIPVLSQEAADVTAYRNLFNEKDPAKKADLCEKFLAETGAPFKESMYRNNTYQLMFSAYAGAKNWDKVLDTAEKLEQLAPTLPNKTKLTTYAGAMGVAQQNNKIPQTVAFGEKVIAVVAKDPSLANEAGYINALFLLPPILVARPGDDAAAKDASFDKAVNYAKKALTVQKPMAFTDAQWASIQGQMHSTIGFVYLQKQQYPDSIAEYESSLKINPKDAADTWRMGINYQSIAIRAQGDLKDAYDKTNEAITNKAEKDVIDALTEKRDAVEKDFDAKLEKAIDVLARAVAISETATDPQNKAVGPLARPALETLWKRKVLKDTPEGLDEFIAQKKTELGGN